MQFNKHYNKWFLSDILRAVKRYALISEGDRICVALSGGKDSITLLFILSYLQKYSPLKFSLSAIHIKTSDYDISILHKFCHTLDIPLFEGAIEQNEKTPTKQKCYICTRLKRGAIADILKKNSIQKVAYGHHCDDAAETFFMNMVFNRKLGSFSPRVQFDNNPMVIIRPMIYLEERVIRNIHNHKGLPILEYKCPHEDENKRAVFKKGMGQLNELFQTDHFSKKVVASLENIDLTNIWSDLV